LRPIGGSYVKPFLCEMAIDCSDMVFWLCCSLVIEFLLILIVFPFFPTIYYSISSILPFDSFLYHLLIPPNCLSEISILTTVCVLCVSAVLILCSSKLLRLNPWPNFWLP